MFEGVVLDAGPRARMALAGRNGSGKSTLLKIAAGRVEADSGERFVHPDATIRYLAQEPDFGEHATAGAYVAATLNNEADAHRGMRWLSAVDIAPETMLAKISGGEAKRIAVAAALAADPDILLLDEPTNHLDLPAISWLEETLTSLDAAIVMVSHDRRFLENLTTETVWLDRGQSRHLPRGFAHFEVWRDQILEEEKAARHKLGRKIAAEEDWVRYGVTARRKRNMRRLAELKDMRKTLREARAAPGSVNFTTGDAAVSGKRVIVADNIAKSYGDDKIVNGFSIEIVRGDKIGIAAPNGAGKTTLIKLLTGALEPDSGTVALGANVELLTLDQHRAELKPDLRLADAIADERGDWVTVGGRKRHVASYLQDFLFAPEQWRAPVKSLSGGEKARLALAAALAKPSNLLALDEPTNDLDLETLDLLEDLLANYEGVLLVISHDRSFLDHVVNSIITTDPHRPGGWRLYPGGYDDMVRQRGGAPGGRRKKRQAQEKNSPTRKPPKSSAEKLSYKEKYALETLPEKIAALEKEIDELTQTLEDPGLFERDPKAFNAAAEALDAARTALAVTEEEWLAVAVKNDALEAKE